MKIKGCVQGSCRGPRGKPAIRGNSTRLEKTGCSSPISCLRNGLQEDTRPDTTLCLCFTRAAPAPPPSFLLTPRPYKKEVGAEDEHPGLPSPPQSSPAQHQEQKQPHAQRRFDSRKQTSQMMQSADKSAQQLFC